MWVVVTYDINTETSKGRSRLRRVAQTCEDYGQRVQKSVFECNVRPTIFHEMRNKLVDIIDEDVDTIRFYKMPEGREKRVEEYGIGNVIDFTGPLMA